VIESVPVPTILVQGGASNSTRPISPFHTRGQPERSTREERS
jgi:hypothetical protein